MDFSQGIILVLTCVVGQVSGYLDFDSWTIPFYFQSDTQHPIVEISKRDADGKHTVTQSHTMAKHSQASDWSTISKYMHYNVSEPVYVGLQMAKVILTRGVNMDRQWIFYRLSQYQFCEIEINIRDNLGRPRSFQRGVVRATLYFRQREIP